MHLLVDISAHGLGHLAQTAPVLNALRPLVPDLRLAVRSALPWRRLAARIAGDFEHIAEARDFGFIMHNAVDVDRPASALRYRELHADWPRVVADEADWLRSRRVDTVVCNAAYLPLVIQEVAGLPLDPSFAAQKKIMQRCAGLFYSCDGGREARRFNRLLMDSGFIKNL